jgi:HD-GYP domain-containing protein (c-di-GMP phosphodiesterase class II)
VTVAADRAWEKAVRSLLTELAAGLVACRLYSTDHPRAVASYSGVVSRATEVIDVADGGEPDVNIVVFRQELFVGGIPFTRVGEQVGALMRHLGRHGIERLSIRRGVTAEEVAAVLAGVSGPEGAALTSTDHVLLGQLVASGAGDDESAPEQEAPEISVRDRVHLIMEAFDVAAGGEALPLGHLTEVVEHLDRRLCRAEDPLEILAYLDDESEWPAVHAHNVAALSLILSIALGTTEVARRELGIAGLLHDLGKICRPPTWISEELSLTGDRWEAVEDHPRLGLELLLSSPHVPEVATVVAFEHHLHWDGGGWPRLPEPRQPHPAAALVSVAEIFDLMHTVRGPRGVLTREGVAATLTQGAGTLFEPFFAQSMQVVWELSAGGLGATADGSPWDFGSDPG